MKRRSMIIYLTKLLSTFENCSIGESEADEILEGLENMGMLPPKVRVDTPMGSQIYFDTNEWEENINIDEAGYEKE